MLEKVHIVTLFKTLLSMGLRIPAHLSSDKEAAIRGYLMVLGELTPDDLSGALTAYVRSGSDFWPSAPKLHSMVPRVAVTQLDLSEDGFATFWRLLSSRGAVALGSDLARGASWVADPEIDRRLKHAAQALGGASSWRVLKTADIGMHRASFRTAYRSVSDHETVTGQPKGLPEGVGRNVVLFPVAGGES